MSIQLTSITLNNNPGDYYADEALVKAVEIAIALGKPILISGEPGTGKTQLAHFVAWQLSHQTFGRELSFLERPLVFNTKSTSVATDLFYTYDAVSHFRNKSDAITTADFIDLKPMGLAIAHTHGKKSEALLGISNIRKFSQLPDEPRSSVVLIDEIDKAPRDFPNDLLNEMEQYEFDIREINHTILRALNGTRIVTIMTSNSEKNLPNAFLRRCVFYHIPFPDKEKLLVITRQRLSIGDNSYDASIQKAIDKFIEIRNTAVNKKPATSEFLDWINLLKFYNLLNGSGSFPPLQGERRYGDYQSTKNVLIKSREDLEKTEG